MSFFSSIQLVLLNSTSKQSTKKKQCGCTASTVDKHCYFQKRCHSVPLALICARYLGLGCYTRR
jgi:hypothetical protein